MQELIYISINKLITFKFGVIVLLIIRPYIYFPAKN